MSGFGRSPVVRQLWVTDSPFPMNIVEEDNCVDEATNNFINRFYKTCSGRSSCWSMVTLKTERGQILAGDDGW
ncbi:hypothetical protein M8C21_024397 [Ambrosia artemisiifolia]|uniref:Uncharacterized protein n=1 Tax=Ambrosia artemisiifolia TaxID=4212 RepID=A0AAD5C392_AMBAR|nr:hypothetical protein M8C21_024397 [Ambrosia artemisiifolia]